MWPFKKKKRDNTVTEAPTQSATPVDQPARNTIPAEQIDEDQKVWASPYYVERIYRKYYSRYPEKPFISKDREKKHKLGRNGTTISRQTSAQGKNDTISGWFITRARIYALLDT